MLYNRVVYDLASIIRLVVDKSSPADRYQALALLKNIKQYLHTCDVPTTAVFDEPLVTVNNLIHTIDDINILKQPTGQGITKAGKARATKSLEASDRGDAPQRPAVSRHAAVKRAPPSYESDDNGGVGGDNDDMSEGEQQLVQEEVVGEDSDWQPIDMLERALTVIANEQSKTSYVFESSAEAAFSDSSKVIRRKSSKGKSGKYSEPRLYLPDHIEFSNPTPRMVSKEGDRKWPDNAQWVCVYCRLIVKSLHTYKAHLRFTHRLEEPCSCRFCKRELPNVEMLNFHLCKEKHQCHVCLKTFNRPHKLRRHLGSHFKSVMTSVTCKVCDDRYSSVISCAVHIYDEHETVIHCDSCVSEIDPHEVTPSDPARVYCLSCLESANGAEPTAVPLNPNIDMSIINTTLNAFDKGDTSTASTQTKRYCDACEEDVVGGVAVWNKHLQMARHIKAVARKSGQDVPGFVCNVCKKVFVSEERLSVHARIHSSDYVSKANKYTCKKCGKVLMTRGGYKNHIASHLGDRRFSCDDCGKTFYSSSTLCDHRNSFHRPDLKYPCSICGEEFIDRKRRTRHVNLVHHNYIYKCPRCELEVRSGSQLRTHIISQHHDIEWTQPLDYRQRSDRPLQKRPTKAPKSQEEQEDYSWRCDVCNVEMKTPLGKSRHLTSATHITNQAQASGSEAVEYECDECGRKFLSLKYLADHVERNHNVDGKKYECDECDKQFVTLGGLRSHKVKHTGIRNFTCSLCPMAFFGRAGLSDHIASVHGGGDKVFPCKKCGQVFKDRKMRTKHVDKAHHNYIFRCPHCDYADRGSVNLKKHMQVCHSSVVWTRPADYRYDETDEEIALQNFSIQELNDSEDEGEEAEAEHSSPPEQQKSACPPEQQKSASASEQQKSASPPAQQKSTLSPTASPSSPSSEGKGTGTVTPEKGEREEVKSPRLKITRVYTSKGAGARTPGSSAASKRESDDSSSAVPSKVAAVIGSGDVESKSTISILKRNVKSP